jgi:hypothetical protein
MEETTFKTRKGTEYKVRFASARQVSKMQGLLGIDVVANALKDLKLAPVIQDEKRLKAVIQTAIEDDFTDDLLDEFNVRDLTNLIIAFFLPMWQGTIVFSNGLNALLSITDQDKPEPIPQKDSPSMSLSIPQDKETQGT